MLSSSHGCVTVVSKVILRRACSHTHTQETWVTLKICVCLYMCLCKWNRDRELIKCVPSWAYVWVVPLSTHSLGTSMIMGSCLVTPLTRSPCMPFPLRVSLENKKHNKVLNDIPGVKQALSRRVRTQQRPQTGKESLGQVHGPKLCLISLISIYSVTLT